MSDPPHELAEPVYRGRSRRIFAYRSADGRVPALEFLEGLERDAKARYLLRFKQMGDDGRLHGKFWHPWDDARNSDAGGLSCFKDNQSKSRVPAFSDESERGVLILTHGFGGKKEDELDHAEIKRAAQIKRDYKARRAAQANVGALQGSVLGGRKGQRR